MLSKLKLENEELRKSYDAVLSENKKLSSLQRIQDQETKDIFEDERTLLFIQTMRGFKKNWSDDHTVSKRKATAASMAEATKNWVSKS